MCCVACVVCTRVVRVHITVSSGDSERCTILFVMVASRVPRKWPHFFTQPSSNLFWRWQPPPPGATKVVSRIISIVIRAKKAKMQKVLGEWGGWPYGSQWLLSRVNSALSFKLRCLLC
jgi:hypothetical protein